MVDKQWVPAVSKVIVTSSRDYGLRISLTSRVAAMNAIVIYCCIIAITANWSEMSKE
jgi:hypothetical protein